MFSPDGAGEIGLSWGRRSRCWWRRLLVGPEDPVDSFDRPVDLLTCDHEGRREANHAIVGVFAQKTLILQGCADRPSGPIQLDPDP